MSFRKVRNPAWLTKLTSIVGRELQLSSEGGLVCVASVRVLLWFRLF